MRNPDVDSRTVDNAVILLSLLVMRHELRKSKAFKPKIRKALLERTNQLIKRYKDPTT